MCLVPIAGPRHCVLNWDLTRTFPVDQDDTVKLKTEKLKFKASFINF